MKTLTVTVSDKVTVTAIAFNKERTFIGPTIEEVAKAMRKFDEYLGRIEEYIADIKQVQQEQCTPEENTLPKLIVVTDLSPTLLSLSA